jgi:uncharacterized membrane protein YkvA (DUF1232 family)
MFGRSKSRRNAVASDRLVDESAIELLSNPEKIAAILDAFPAKLSQTSGKVPFSEQVTAAYYAARDPKTSLKVKATLAAAIAYFILPTDLIPDFVAGFGFTDDFAVIMLVLKRLGPAVKPEHYALARRRLQRDQESS